LEEGRRERERETRRERERERERENGEKEVDTLLSCSIGLFCWPLKIGLFWKLRSSRAAKFHS